jgi:hypothetical protein
VGIGGVTWKTGATSGSLLQTGVRTQCVGGRQRDAGWFELYPSKPNESADFAGFPASPGDSIKASVYRASGRAWVTRLDDLTAGISGWMVTGEGWGVARDRGNGRFSGQGATDGLSYAGGYTAEWIVEDYSENGSRVPLADYGAVTFAHLTTSLRSWSLTPGDAETMAQDGVVLSTPSPPSGNGFSVTSTPGASTLPAHAREAR